AQRKTKSYSPQVVMTQTTRRKSSRLSSNNNTNLQTDINQQFDLPNATGYSTSLPSVQQHTLNNRTRSNLSRSIILPNLNAGNGNNGQAAETIDDNSLISSEENYSNMVINHSEGSSFGQSRQSSILSISRDASFYETESGRSESCSSTPFITSEISLGRLHSDISSGLPSRSSSAYQSAFLSVNQSFSFNDDSIAFTDNIKLDNDQRIQPEPSGLIDDTEHHEVGSNPGNEENTEHTLSEDQNQEESGSYTFRYIPRVLSSIEDFWNTVVWWLSRLEVNYVEPLKNKILDFYVIRAACNNFRSNNVNEEHANASTERGSRRMRLGIFCFLIFLYIAFVLIKSSKVDTNGDNDELGQNDELIQSVVANQVKTLCAAEVQKRIPSTNQEMTRYRSNAVPNENVVVMVRQEVQRAVEEMLYTYSQDKLNKADFALSSGGAKIISPLTSPTYEQWPTQWYKLILASTIGHGITRGKPPITAIQPDTHVGQCWPFSGQQGQLAVLLSRQVYVTSVTYDHISKKVAMGTTSAPKEIEVWGFIDGDLEVKDKGADTIKEDIPGYINEQDTVNELGSNILDSSHLQTKGGELKLGSSPTHIFLGQFVYDLNGPPIQTFEVNKINKPIRAVILKVNSNWDNPEYTCLYRFRVHGERSGFQN
ncbi:7549_t:CDS:1, partial [Acaulospora morrowiae]